MLHCIKNSIKIRSSNPGKLFFIPLGSSKINKHCTAAMRVETRSSEQVHVQICHTHHSHDHELQHTRVSQIKRQEVAMKIREGISGERILDDIRESFQEDLHRHHLVDKNDLTNITALNKCVVNRFVIGWKEERLLRLL